MLPHASRLTYAAAPVDILWTHACFCRCESVRKVVERVFGMFKKRFRILKLPMLGRDINEIEDKLFSCFILHNMIMQDKGRMDMGHMHEDWCDHAPAAGRARRALYDIVNGRTLLFNFRACMQAAYVDISSFSFSCCMLQNEFLCIDDNTPKRGTITKKVQEQKRLVEELVVQHANLLQGF